MNHWTDGPEPDDGASDGEALVRPFTITRGRTVPDRGDLELITVVTALAPGVEADPRPGLEPEHRSILRLCRAPEVVAEIAAAMDLPVSVVKILVGDLLDLGMVAIEAPVARRGALDPGLLKAVRDGLERL